MDVNEIIEQIRVQSSGRTRFEGSDPHWDELLVAEIDRLRKENEDLEAYIEELLDIETCS